MVDQFRKMSAELKFGIVTFSFNLHLLIGLN